MQMISKTRISRNSVLPVAVLILIYLCWSSKGRTVVKDKSRSYAVFYPPAVLHFNSTEHFLSSNLASPSRLGNHIFEFASLFGLSERLHRTPLFLVENEFHQKMLDETRKVMPGLVEKFTVINGSLPKSIKQTPFQKVCCRHENPEILEKIDEKYLHLTGMFYQSWKYFPNMREQLLDFLDDSSQDFGNLPRSNQRTHVTCVHARRGDFVDVGFQAADPDFIRNSVKYIAENFIPEIEYKKVHRKVVIFGDDLEFMRSLFENSVVSTDEPEYMFPAEYYISQNSPAEDLTYSKQNCDIVLISAPKSTFGWWIGYFSKGNKVFYRDIRYAKDRGYDCGRINENDFYPSHWVPLKFSASDVMTIVESLQ